MNTQARKIQPIMVVESVWLLGRSREDKRAGRRAGSYSVANILATVGRPGA